MEKEFLFKYEQFHNVLHQKFGIKNPVNLISDLEKSGLLNSNEIKQLHIVRNKRNCLVHFRDCEAVTQTDIDFIDSIIYKLTKQ